MFATERWLTLSARIARLATLAAAATVLAGAGFVAWRYGLPWAEARIAASSWSGAPLVTAAAAGTWASAGWLAAFVVTASRGPVRWLSEWSVRRANRELWGSSPPRQSNCAATAQGQLAGPITRPRRPPRGAR